MSFDKLVESKIQEAMEAGAFRNLRGHGKPLADLSEDRLAGDNWMGFHVLRNGGLLPAWLGLAREIERELEDLKRIDDRHALLATHARDSGLSKSLVAALAATRLEYEQFARRIRVKQDQFNFDAPIISLERPGIWVELELERLDARVPGR